MNICFAQKPALDYSTLTSFPVIVSSGISNNGKYVLYVVNHGSASSLFVCSGDNTFKKEFRGPAGVFLNAVFSEDNSRAVFMLPGDSLCILELLTKKELYIPQCQSFKMPKDGNGEWLAYQLVRKDLILYNFSSGKRAQYPGVDEYLFADSGKLLLFKNRSGIDSNAISDLHWVNLTNGKAVSIWQGRNAGGFVFDKMENQLAFIAETNKHGQAENEIWCYQAGMDSARLCVNRETAGFEDGFSVENAELRFSGDGQRLFFRESKTLNITKQQSAGVDIWSYKDQFLQSEQLANLRGSRSFIAVVSLNDNKVTRLEQEYDKSLFNVKLNKGGNDDYLLMETNVNSMEGYRLPDERPDIYMVNTRNGFRKCIRHKALNAEFWFSPGGRYVYWYDVEKKAYFTYNIQSGVTNNISERLGTSVHNELWDHPSPSPPYGPAVWLQNDEAILIYDRYDIWQLHPEGKKTSVNITNGFGRRNRIVLRYTYLDGKSYIEEGPVEKGKTVILCAFDEKNKNNGFFRKKLDEPGDPVQLIMSPEVFYFSAQFSFVSFPRFLQKAKQASIYLLKRMNATEYPNLQITKDFREFKAISALSPQKKYNWLTSELIHWTTFDGRPGTGILYKPENFDPRKKYPLIFSIYERLSDGLNKFIEPELSIGPLNISFFVSQGYLVFCPDIYYTVGEPGESAYNYVVSAAEMLSQREWVNKEKIGIHGHSFGGYEVNYLVTRTKLFAAAASAAGPSDFVSDCGTLKLDMLDGHSFSEQAQPRLGANLWENQAAYIKNSPVFGADKVTSPLLIMHNKQDYAVSWSQGVEFFTGLRRLGKRVWMLQYDNGGHVLYDDKDKLDYSMRLHQFFDHYLREIFAPKWMTVGIPAFRKEVDTGFELDASSDIQPDKAR
jgi:dipeptidyl aminopeptidase/acylaminoacyl peptidase